MPTDILRSVEVCWHRLLTKMVRQFQFISADAVASISLSAKKLKLIVNDGDSKENKNKAYVTRMKVD